MRSISYFLPIFFLLLFTSCGGDRFEVDVDDVELNLPIRRLDVELFSLNTAEVPAFHKAKIEEGDPFYTLYMEQILGAGPMEDSLTPIRLQRFLLDPNWSEAQTFVEKEFGDMSVEQGELENAFKRYITFFPSEKAPQINTFNAGFNFAIYPTEADLSIGIEWFLGDSNPVIQRLAPDMFPEYKKRRMAPEYLVGSAMTGWLFVHHYKDLAGEDLLGNMVHHGKVLFALDKILPDTPDSLIIGYTQAQLDWCALNEFNVWAELAVNDALFSKKPREIGRFMNDAPFTNGFPPGSPGRIGEWIGWQMVEAYMEAHPEMTIEELFGDIDTKEVMKSYRPNKN